MTGTGTKLLTNVDPWFAGAVIEAKSDFVLPLETPPVIGLARRLLQTLKHERANDQARSSVEWASTEWQDTEWQATRIDDTDAQ